MTYRNRENKMQFKAKPFAKYMAKDRMIKFDAKGFYTAKNDEESAFLTYVKGVEKVETKSAERSVESKPKTKRVTRKSDSFV